MNESASRCPTSSYAEWTPPRAWRTTVACQWEQRISNGEYVQRVLPDGCADLIVDDDARTLLAGPARHVSLPHLKPGSWFRGLRLRSEAIGAVLGVPASELVDQTVPLDAVVSPRQARALVEVLVEGRTTAAWWADSPIDPRLRVVCAGLQRETGSADDLPDRVGLSSRQLRRLLLDATGLGPKTLQRVGRLQRFVALADAAGVPSPLATLASVAGYADQAHLSREVRDLGGTTPRALVAERRQTVMTAAN